MNNLERISMNDHGKDFMVVIREHLIRYTFALQELFGKDVLDVACGTGYGMYLMSYYAKSVSGYDYNREALEEARKFSFKCDCCLEERNLEEDKSLTNSKHEKFDVVTCFETIEHLSNPGVLLSRIKEIVKPEGFIYLSTPNTGKELKDDNEWHKYHFNFFTLNDLIKINFDDPHVEIFGQDQYGLTYDFNKPYIVIKISL